MTVPAEKRCPRCKAVKPVSAFGKHKGQRYDLACYCKPCANEYNRPRKRKPRKWWEGTGVKPCAVCQAVKALSEFRRVKENKDGRSGTCKACRKLKYGHKEQARRIVNNRIKRGIIQRASACQQCGRPGKMQGHHEDYAQPLKVVWLCSKCHWVVHRAKERSKAI